MRDDEIITILTKHKACRSLREINAIQEIISTAILSCGIVGPRKEILIGALNMDFFTHTKPPHIKCNDVHCSCNRDYSFTNVSSIGPMPNTPWPDSDMERDIRKNRNPFEEDHDE